METIVNDFKTLYRDENIKIRNPYLSKVYQEFNFLYITKEEENNIEIVQKLKTEIIVIKIVEYEEEQYFVMCFEKTLLLVTQKVLSFLKSFFSLNSDSDVYFLNDKELSAFMDTIEKSDLKQFESRFRIADEIFKEEIHNFFKETCILSREFRRKFYFFDALMLCLSGYLIKKSYAESRINRIEKCEEMFGSDSNEIELKRDGYIYLRTLGHGSISRIELIYHIEKRKLFALKMLYYEGYDTRFRIKLERNNYLSIHHPFICRCFGMDRERNYLVLEYIQGHPLSHAAETLSVNEKIKIILEISLVISYLHSKNFIYRDLKPSNIMIDHNKTAVLIDFDRMLHFSEEEILEGSLDLCGIYQAPEIPYGICEYNSDTYSLGMIIKYMFERENKYRKEILSESFSPEFLWLKKICEQCLQTNCTKRPPISAIIDDIYFNYYSKIYPNISEADTIKTVKSIHTDKFHAYWLFIAEFSDPYSLLNLGLLYEKGKIVSRNIEKAFKYLSLAAEKNIAEAQIKLGDIYFDDKNIFYDVNKAIHYYLLAANQNNPAAQFILGCFYYDGKFVHKDFDKAICYLSLAADQNFHIAEHFLNVIKLEGESTDDKKNLDFNLTEKQSLSHSFYDLGVAYFKGKYISKDINKAIHFFSLSANQNNPVAQLDLGMIYKEGRYVSRDIDKAIHYYSLAANQNFPQAQFNLGMIYNEGKYVTRDINKAIHYYSLAANQNFPQAQFNLGMIYNEGRYVTRDINKAIHYYSLAANQNIPQAQFNLGMIYNEGRYVTRDINKAIHYYSLAANQNFPQAQFNLGLMYNEGKYVPIDINKAIHYYSLAANQNNENAQFNLGLIYSEGKYVIIDIDKAIHYYSLAANQNHLKSMFNLGMIYYKGEYVSRDINKAIHYFSLAANLDSPNAQFLLGSIYLEGSYVSRNIDKAIYYLKLAANQKMPEAQFYLGIIYYDNKYASFDIEKAIHYLSLAAKNNIAEAEFYLGKIHYTGHYVPKDIYRAIYHLSHAAEQNHPEALLYLGLIYYTGRDIKTNISKAIHYFSLAASMNNSDAQYNLGVIYYTGRDIPMDIEKAIHYFLLAASMNNPDALYNLGVIYYSGKYMKSDVNKAIRYFTLASYQNHCIAQYTLGMLYLNGIYGVKYIKKGLYFMELSALNRNFNAYFVIGSIYHEGIFIKRDINKSIYYYKNAASLNNQYAKNNLGIIYRHGSGDVFHRNAANSIEFFKEAIHQKKDEVSMYNLAHIYLYEEFGKERIDNSIELLIESSNLGFQPSKYLLCIALIKKYGTDLRTLKEELSKFANIPIHLLVNILEIFNYLNLYNKASFEELYECYRVNDYIYNYNYEVIRYKDFIQVKEETQLRDPHLHGINALFYEGFGLEI